MNDADNLIYNRYDIIYPDEYVEYVYQYLNQEYVLRCHVEGDTSSIDIWGREIPKAVFYTFIDDVFRREPEVRFIKVEGSNNDYHGRLEMIRNVYINLPDNADKINERLSSKTLHTLERKERRLLEKYGSITVKIYSNNIPKKLTENYFSWKKVTHGTDYNMSSIEYLKKYHVTHALELVGGEKSIAVVFYCVCEKTAYLENLSFDSEVAKFSAGMIAYKRVLEWLSENGINRFYLGKEGQEYKNHFGSIKQDAYWGNIINKNALNKAKLFLAERRYKEIAIYGLGNVGREFLRYSDALGVKVVYAIDRKVKNYDSLMVYGNQDVFPACDVVIITLESRNEEIENILNDRGLEYLYWRKLL